MAKIKARGPQRTVENLLADLAASGRPAYYRDVLEFIARRPGLPKDVTVCAAALGRLLP